MSTIILGRYRLILVPVLILYAAVSITTFFNMIWRRQMARAIASLVLISGVAVIQNWLLPIPLLRVIPSFTIHGPLYSLSARVYASNGKFDQALGELNRLQMRARQYPDFPDDFLGIPLYEGDYGVARAMHLLEEARPQAAREQLALAESAYVDRFHLSRPYYNLGLLYLKLAEPTKAQSLLERFLKVESEGTRADSVRQILSELRPTSSSHSSLSRVDERERL